jgi:sugar (pentulose or hexulose) kinase
MSGSKPAALLGLDVTTTEFALAVSDGRGNEDYVSTPMLGATSWRSDPAFPAFDLQEVPAMLLGLLSALQDQGWDFHRSDEPPGHLSVACRQHDLVVLDKDGAPLLPAISWQCNAAEAETAALRQMGVEAAVGKIEPRLVLPKLQCVLHREAALAKKIGTVFMTGDWIAHQLTGARSLSTSDALSNGLLQQRTRRRADEVIRKAGFDLDWFPNVVQSGEVAGCVQPPDPSPTDRWRPVKEILEGWRFVAGLGDNHASAVGCGMKDDHRRLVVSGGTSGTINRSCPSSAKLPEHGGALRFEFYDKAVLLLLMLGDCGAWYQRFVDGFALAYKSRLEQLNLLALAADLSAVRRVLHCDSDHAETFPPEWPNMDLGLKVASTQLSIMLELLLRVKQMFEEVRGAAAPAVEECVLTGGLSRSAFFQQVFHAGLQLLAPGAAVKLSGRTGPLRYKTSAYGALINAQLPLAGGSLARLHAEAGRFPLADCAQADPVTLGRLQHLLRSHGV